ncbi:CheA signal transduction histidine kinase [Sulfuricurvum kujiense DSM 16994]|uniref:Chemotaxis protein CheA n=1 Tax=Sulfuricurvum kujiense (strain ATCC BAA-921 / DSM 16994 / JCM 11577 / YK-1) TaxID=709032 RepID=E4U2P9_SULKY|nr:chemotaxis protein CheA [Sulfuricurvum kujiense]ADR33634.1 CheA signal transduction histidine kinase [Sulfuricurvum kujiense DSM 16994]
MTEELKLFLEDSDEQLNFMESALINMQDQGVNEEDIGALFRAMHTIKGTAGMFNFDDVVSFAHIAENLLSEVRAQKVELTPELISLFLLCKDHTESLISASIDQKPIDDEIRETNDRLVAQLLKFTPGSSESGTDSSLFTETSVSSDGVSEETLWHISLGLKVDFFSTGMDVLNLIAFLNRLGKVIKKAIVTDHIPTLEHYNPIEAYIGFELQFSSRSSASEIEEVFEFVLDDIDLVIFETDDKQKLLNWIDTLEEKQSKVKFLISNGFFTKADFVTEEESPVIQSPLKSIETRDENKVTQEETKSAKKEQHKSFSLRVESSKIDQLINQMSEMVIANAKIAQRADILDDAELSESSAIMSDMLESVRSSVMNIRMVQVGDSFTKFRRIVNDAAKKLGKEIEFIINGGETELDKTVVEKISDPLMHMLRNSIDHGIETPQERIAAGKPEKGTVTLSAYPDAGTIVIKIVDDGKGLDKDKILEKAIAQGIVNKNQTLTNKEIFTLIFAAGLSTADQVSDISGRGVGMDVVKRNIEELRGTVEIDSKEGEGSTFTIRLPLTLAIIDGFLIQSGDTKYIIPLEMIQECIELSPAYKEHMKGNHFINLRDSILPLLDIRTHFNEGESRSGRENVVVLRYGEYKMGLQVDELYGEFQTVIKPLGDVFVNVAGISGGTILGSGEIALIFDIPKLIEQKMRQIN